MNHDARRDEYKRNATQLILAGDYWPISQPDYFDVRILRGDEQDIAEYKGGCSRCSDAELFEHVHGDGSRHVICRWTGQPCQRHELAEIISLYERAFQ